MLKDPIFTNLVRQEINNIIDTYKPEDITDFDPFTTALTVNDQLSWETLKVTLRGEIIRYSAKKKKGQVTEERDLEQKILYLQQISPDLTETERNNLVQFENKLKEIREKKVQGIITRSKARWLAQGEKNTNYFCHLEKRNFLEKTITKLINEESIEVEKVEDILSEQRTFYSNLYSSKNLDQDANEHIFLNDYNPFISKLSEENKQKCEGKISYTECANVLKNMKNDRSPGLDGYTTEFFKFFWQDLSRFL